MVRMPPLHVKIVEYFGCQKRDGRDGKTFLPKWLSVSCAALGVAWLTAYIPAASAQDASCLECHQDESLTMERADAEVSLFVSSDGLAASQHAGFTCTDCHEGFDANAFPHRDPVTPVNCLLCHGGLGATHVFHPRLATLTEPSGEPDLSCSGCHGKHDVVAVADSSFRFAPAKRNESCGSCHEAEFATFASSAHFGTPGGPYPDCLNCHATDVVDGERTPLEMKLAQSQLCLSCHVDSPAAAARTRLAGRFVASWGSSVHGQALEGGNGAAANCVDCHGSHAMQRGMVADSRVNKLHIAETCHACHAAEADEYSEGIHALALQRGIRESPVCTDCHGEHLIFAAHDPRSPVAPRNVSQQLCGDCHGSVRLSEKYGISSDRFETFSDSFHGLAVRGGAVEVVNCASCHGYHLILPSSDPLSPVNKANLAQTCGQCHPGANQRFAVGAVHITMDPAGSTTAAVGGDWIIQVIASIYVWLIGLVVGSMFLHNALDFFKKVRRKVRGQVFGVHDSHVPHRLYLRMTVNERLQHGTLVLSFLVLVITGFMLRFPEAWWVEMLRNFSDHLFELRSLLHRIAAVVMCVSGAWHLWYVTSTKRGREVIRDLWPRWRDLADMGGVLRYNLGLAKTKPRFGRFSYIEKAEYWALLWGSLIMTVTGVLLWADETTMQLLAKLGFDIARTVHYYEAILATLSIVVWHFYAVIFNPDVYPMNLSWLTGRLSEEEMADEHPGELERLQRLEREAQSNPAANATE